MKYKVPYSLLIRTFDHFRQCGQGRCECQALWTSAWHNSETITEVVHPIHEAHAQGFSVDATWLNDFWLRLSEINYGIRVQVHTHPFEAFHSPTDDAYPIIHTPGFLSLVIPNFAMGLVSLKGAYLTEIMLDGSWHELRPEEKLEII